MQVIRCEQCGQKMRFSAEKFGRHLKCPHCSYKFVLRSKEEPDVPNSPEVASARALEFKVVFKNDPKKVLKGVYQAMVTNDGLRLIKKNGNPVLIPFGTPANYLGGNRLTVTLDDRPVEVRISQFLIYQKRLAKDLVAFLKSGKPLKRRGYAMERYLLVPVVLPLGIPLLTLGGALPGALGFGLAGGCYALMQKEEWSIITRMLLGLGLAGLGYGTLVVVVIAAFLTRGGLDWFGSKSADQATATRRTTDTQPMPRAARTRVQPRTIVPVRPRPTIRFVP